MTVREGLNYAYAHIVYDMREEDRQARMQGHKFEETIEDRIHAFEEKIGLRPDHEELALWMHKNVLLPARGFSKDEIDEMFDETAAAALPSGIGEEHRWRYEDTEWDGLADFQGNPWELEGMGDMRKQAAEQAKAERAEEKRETLG